MVVEESKFRSFIASLDKFLEEDSTDEEGFILFNKILNSIEEYKTLLNKEPNSKWKQLKIDL